MRELEELVQLLWKDHFPRAPADRSNVALAEQRLGLSLPRDIAEFYCNCDGAALFREYDSPFRILPLSDLAPVSQLMLGYEEPTVRNWIGFCDIRDGNYLAIDAASASGQVLDCFHETFPDVNYVNVVAPSFSAFLEKALRAGGRHYWLHDEAS